MQSRGLGGKQPVVVDILVHLCTITVHLKDVLVLLPSEADLVSYDLHVPGPLDTDCFEFIGMLICVIYKCGHEHPEACRQELTTYTTAAFACEDGYKWKNMTLDGQAKTALNRHKALQHAFDCWA